VEDVPNGGAAAPREEGKKPGEMARPPLSPLQTFRNSPPHTFRNSHLAREGHHCRAYSTERMGLRVQLIGCRSKDGPTTPGNLTVFCGRCHALVHEGLLTIEGVAPPALTFQRQEGKEDTSGSGTMTLGVDPPRRGAAAPRQGGWRWRGWPTGSPRAGRGSLGAFAPERQRVRRSPQGRLPACRRT